MLNLVTKPSTKSPSPNPTLSRALRAMMSSDATKPAQTPQERFLAMLDEKGVHGTMEFIIEQNCHCSCTEQEARRIAGCMTSPRCQQSCRNQDLVKSHWKVATCATFLKLISPSVRNKWPWYLLWKEYLDLLSKDPQLDYKKEHFIELPHINGVLPPPSGSKTPEAYSYRGVWWTREHFRCFEMLTEDEMSWLQDLLTPKVQIQPPEAPAYFHNTGDYIEPEQKGE